VGELLANAKAAAEAPDATSQQKNRYAWSMLTIEPADLRDPEEALRFAIEAAEMDGFADANILDTLALAYFDNGQVDKAIEIQERAVSLLSESTTRTEFEGRLNQYREARGSGDG